MNVFPVDYFFIWYHLINGLLKSDNLPISVWKSPGKCSNPSLTTALFLMSEDSGDKISGQISSCVTMFQECPQMRGSLISNVRKWAICFYCQDHCTPDMLQTPHTSDNTLQAHNWSLQWCVCVKWGPEVEVLSDKTKGNLWCSKQELYRRSAFLKPFLAVVPFKSMQNLERSSLKCKCYSSRRNLNLQQYTQPLW